MKPKEIQKKLDINAERIKLFKREGIFYPENLPTRNKPTDYTEMDLKKLRLIVILTKSGLTCSDIKKIQKGECSLEEAFILRKENIEADIERKRNSLSLISNLLAENVTYETLDTEYYWNLIDEREAVGDSFVDIEEYYNDFEISLIRNICCKGCGKIHEVNLEDYVYDESSEEKENGMGADILYSIDSEDSYECPDCNKRIHIKGWIREYPLGAWDSENIEVI